MDEHTSTATNSVPDERPGLAMIANCMTPYRANLHRLIAAGIPELKLHTLITHGPAEFEWSIDVPESIHATAFGSPDDSPTASPLSSPLREWRKGARLIEYLRTHDVRAVVCLGYRYSSYLRVMKYCYHNHVPLFVHNDSNIKSDQRLRLLKAALKRRIYAFWMPWVTGIMSMGEYGDRFFLKYGADPRRIYRVPCTPDYDRYARIDTQNLSRFRQKFGLRDDRRHIIYSGRLVQAKRVDLLIDAFAAIAGERPDWDLLIVGEGNLHRELVERVPDSLRKRVVWTGFLEGSELEAAYHVADLLVLPSDFEPWALVIQEAIAAGLAVVASDVVGAAHEIIEDRVSGRIFPAGDLSTLTEAILDVSDKNEINRYQDSARSALADWRKRVDPVAEVRRALFDAGALAPAMPASLESAR